jgi:NADPH2:quinone reductase
MRAVWLRKTGGPEVLAAGDAPDPVAGPGQVLIEVELANVTFVETQLRAGTAPFSLELPAIPGNGVGGVVAAVGPGVDAHLVGRRVVSSMGGSGGYAELAVVDADEPIEVPAGLGLDAAVALLADGRTAVSLVRAAQPRTGERVLVEAAAGGVGSLLVQLARSEGAEVVAAAGGERKLKLARELGARVAVDYREPDWGERVREECGGVDVVFDGVGGDVARVAFERRVGADLRGGRGATGRRACPARSSQPRGAARADRGRPHRGGGGPPAARNRPALPARAGRRRARGNRGARNARQDPARGAALSQR